MRYKLGEICEIVSGSTPKTSIPEYWDGDIKWITPAELNDDSYIINDSVRKITELGVKKTGLSPFPVGTVLLSSRAPIGKVAIAGCEMYCNQGFKNLICSDKINNRYLFWFLKGNTKYLNSLGRGATFKEISKQIVSSIEINVPNVKEQEDAVNVLEQVSDIIHSRKQELQMLDDLIRARFVEMFGDPGCNEKGWPTKPLLSMGFCKNGMNFHYDDSGVELNCLGVGDFKDYSIIADTATLPTVSLNEMPSPEYLLQDDDIVFVRSNGNKKMVGRSVAVYPGSVPTTFSGFCIRFRRNDDLVITPYLLRVLKAESMRQKMYGRGANIQNLNQHTLSSLYIPVPPKTMQEEFATFVAQVDKSKYQAEPNSRKYHIHRLRKQYQELTDSLFLYFTKLFEVIILQKGIC